MKQHIESLMYIALKQLQEAGDLPAIPAFIQIDAAKNKQYGDFASNVALIIARIAQKKPRDIAKQIIAALPPSKHVQKVEIAGPGFINFFISEHALEEVVTQILTQKEAYGRCKMGRGKRILVEFLSSNPTGPLHVGHGRHVVFGSVVSNLLNAVGFKSFREYYINDMGRQMDIMTVSIWLRYLVLCGEDIVFPTCAYQGEYILGIAKAIRELHHTHFYAKKAELFSELNSDTLPAVTDEKSMDLLIEQAKRVLGDKYQAVFDLGLQNILADIREDLAEFGITYDNWFSERQFAASNEVDRMLAKFSEVGCLYEHEGALWFRSTTFGDEKDRVLVRSNGLHTYFANDIAYHLNKFERGFDIVIDIFGPGHHGYVPRMKAALQASGVNPERLIHLLVQFVTLYRQGEPFHLSNRCGNMVTLRELRTEVGNDAVRFNYVMHRSEHQMDFDLDLAKTASSENPVYYVQYAHARICSVLQQAAERHIVFAEANGLANLHLLKTSHERQLLNTLSRYPDMIMNAALRYEPHLLPNYLRQLAADFHAYYHSHPFLVEESALCDARLALITATRQVLLNGFNLLGISAPESM